MSRRPEGANERGQSPDALPQESVVVATARVPRDGARRLRVAALLAGRPLVSARETHDAPRAGQDRLAVQAGTGLAMAGEPAHLSVHSGSNERLVALDVSFEAHVGSCDRNCVETQLVGLRADTLAEPFCSGIMIGK